MTLAQMLNEVRNEARLEGRKEARKEAREECLCSLIKTVRSLVGDDYAKVCEIIRENEIYAQTSDEEIRKYWD